MLSVIIATKDRKNVLSETMKLLLSADTDMTNVSQLIIVNDGSDDLTEYEQYEKVIVVKNKGRGVASGRNTGAELATAPYLLFFDDDILIERNHFNKHLEVHRRFPDALVTANRFYPEHLIREAEKTPFGRYKLKNEYNWLVGCELTRIDADLPYFWSSTLAGFSCSMPKRIWQELAGFNESFPYAGCEDNEFYVRAKKSGAKLIFDESNTCYHNELDNFTLKRWVTRQATGIKGAIIICEIHPEGKEHPTYYLNEPLKGNETKEIRKMKRKKIILSRGVVLQLFYTLTKAGEFLKFPDSILYRFYNAIWVGETKNSFMQAYRDRGHG